MSNRKQSGPHRLDRERFPELLRALEERGFEIHGPTLRDGAIVHDRIHSVQDLPVGWTDDQAAGSYRLQRRPDEALFGYTVGPYAWKRLFHPPRVRLFHTQREDGEISMIPEDHTSPPYALLGVRACEIAAIRLQDQVFLEGEFVDPVHAGRRRDTFIVAANCTRAGGTCFCASMGTGPRARHGFDLALTEIVEEGDAGEGRSPRDPHRFLVEVGSERGSDVVADLRLPEASSEDQELATMRISEAAGSMGRSLNTYDIKELLYDSLEHPRWQEVGNRCLTCGNCTLVCPTCFCTSVEDTTDLTGDHAERWRRWDSCFTTDFSYVHGGSVRNSPASRFRQWMTHKLASWEDQFGDLGCVGCGRCITWCPVGIDITEEAGAIRASVEEAEALAATGGHRHAGTSDSRGPGLDQKGSPS